MTKRTNGRPVVKTDVVIIGAGHAGLSFSHSLAESGIEHVILERGEIANSWRHERWDSLTLLTPNWQCRVPGHTYSGDDPDGYMDVPQLVEFIDEYAQISGAPVRTNTEVQTVASNGDSTTVSTQSETWSCRSVVLATGACNIPVVPPAGEACPTTVRQLTPHEYRSPDDLDTGGVLIVGASATGLQIGEEIQAAGHDVTIAVGEHVRMPRTYRGKDILWWMDRVGIWNERYDEVDDITRARRLPSPQLIGTADKASLDLNRMTDKGARLVGRLMGFNGNIAQFSGSLRNVCALADLKMGRMLNNIDEWILEHDDESNFDSPTRFDPTRVDESPPLTINLEKEGIRTILWATGFRPDYSWLDLPILDYKGRLKHDGGVTGIPGVYVIGLPVLRRRKSSFIFGIEDDVRDLQEHLQGHLDRGS